jgi:hypothetical protein
VPACTVLNVQQALFRLPLPQWTFTPYLKAERAGHLHDALPTSPHLLNSLSALLAFHHIAPGP